MLQNVYKALQEHAQSENIAVLQRFFKSGKGEYAAGDKFLGIKVPNTRKVVKKYFKILDFSDLKTLLYSEYHEVRLFSLLTLVAKYEKGSEVEKKAIFEFYLKHIGQVNNWDLVDVTAPHIIGKHLLEKDRTLLYKLAHSEKLWEKRIAIVSSFTFIKHQQFEDTLQIADILLHDTHDLIHKAVGWAIRNVGNQNEEVMLEFLRIRYKNMPRTALRYAIEKLDEPLRQKYLKGLI